MLINNTQAAVVFIIYNIFSQSRLELYLPIIKRNHVFIWNWIQMYKQTTIDHSKESNEFIINEAP